MSKHRYRPRYTIGTVTGYSMASGRSGLRPLSISYVYDRLYCYRPIAEFVGVRGEEQARKFAGKCNEEERERQRSIGWIG